LHTARKSGSDGRIRVHIGCGHLIQTWWPNTRATEFELVSNLLGGAHPSLNWMAKSNINMDVAMQARFSGHVETWFSPFNRRNGIWVKIIV
jgi:hypothetical protein